MKRKIPNKHLNICCVFPVNEAETLTILLHQGLDLEAHTNYRIQNL